MAGCQLCHGLEKADPDDSRLASDFTPKQLLDSKSLTKCFACSFILEGILRFEDASWTFVKDVSRVYLYALENESDSLTLEIYFHADRPKLVLEFFTAGECANFPVVPGKAVYLGSSCLKTNNAKIIHLTWKLFGRGHV
jgi:hypothetical protein